MLITYLLLAALSPFSHASSYERNPLSAIEPVRDASIDTHSHRVSAFQKFDLSFFAFKRRIRFALEPNHDILPPDARVNYLGPDGEIIRSEPIDRHLHRVYKGDVWSENVDGTFKNVGHARIVIHDDGKKPLFEGSFSIDYDHHHIQLREKYMSARHKHDPVLSKRHENEAMVIFRDSDSDNSRDNVHQEFRKRNAWPANDHVACPSDSLEFNMDVEHPIFAGTPVEEGSNYWGVPMSSLFGKRQLDSPSGPGNSAGVNLVSTIGSTTGCPTTRKVTLNLTPCSHNVS
jgi:hypothetical protein